MKVHVTLWPDRELDVSPQEAADLRAQGLLVPEAPAPVPAPKTPFVAPEMEK